MPGKAIIQAAYVVPDVRSACERFHVLYGIGPFFVIPGRPRPRVRHFGEAIAGELVTEVALAQSGDVQIELLTQQSEVPSAYRDMFGPADQGFHHIAFWTDDYAADCAAYVAAGFEIAMEMEFRPGLDMAYVDTRSTLGHMIELLPRVPSVVDTFEFVRRESESWAGGDLIRPMPARRDCSPAELAG